MCKHVGSKISSGTPQAPVRHPTGTLQAPIGTLWHPKTTEDINTLRHTEKWSLEWTHSCVTMPYSRRRHCPICFKPDLLSLSHHLSQVHQLTSDERKPWLKVAVFSHAKTFPSMIPLPCWSMQQQTMGLNPPFTQPQAQTLTSTPRKVEKPSARVPNRCLETSPCSDFKFNHMFSMLVVGPSQCGKTHFVEKILTENCIHYPSTKRKHIDWYYNQWQPRYKSLQSALGDAIQFTQGLPDLSEDLHEISPKCNNILVFDDLMAQATDSPVLSKLFTQGRHRNASVILLLQNMFPKGQFNTDISRNAQYLVLFRSPSDRKQIDIIAERIFARHDQKFCCLTQRHRWQSRVSCLWGDRDDHMETTNRPSRPDRLEIFWKDWGDRDDPDDHMETRLNER